MTEVRLSSCGAVSGEAGSSGDATVRARTGPYSLLVLHLLWLHYLLTMAALTMAALTMAVLTMAVLTMAALTMAALTMPPRTLALLTMVLRTMAVTHHGCNAPWPSAHQVRPKGSRELWCCPGEKVLSEHEP